MGSAREPGPRQRTPGGRDPSAGAAPDPRDPGETAVDLDNQDAPVAEVDLEEVYDKPGKTDTDSLRRFDPEAGKMGIAVKLRAVRQSLSTPGGRVVFSIPVALAGVSTAIFAASFPAWPVIVAAAVLGPASLLLLYIRYQQWLGHKRYMYRLLESLGEDVTDFDPRKVYRARGRRPRSTRSV